MSIEEDDESDLRLRRRFAEVVSFYGKTLRNFWAIAKEPRQVWRKLRSSHIANNFIFSLFISELTGLVLVLVLMVVFSFLGYVQSTAVLAAIGIAHYLLDAPFDFWLWPRSCKALYPKKRWKRMYVADMGYFCLAGKVIDWLALVFQGALALVLLSYFSLPDTFAAPLSHAIQIPLYMLIYTTLCAPMILAREEELGALADSKNFIRALNMETAGFFSSLIAPRRSPLAIFVKDATVLDFCIQSRAGPVLT